MRRPTVLACAFVLVGALALTPAAWPEPAANKRVLVVYATGRLLPAIVAFDKGFRGLLGERPNGDVEIYDEFLDAARFSGPEYDRAVADHLRQKYSSLPPDVVVVVAREALRFAVRQQHLLPAGTPVVHAVVGTDDLAELGPMPPGFVGVPTVDEFKRTIEQALRWHPQARRLVVVLGVGTGRDRAWRAKVMAEKVAFEPRLTVDVLEGLTTEEATARLAVLGPDTIVFSPGYELDTVGHFDAPFARIRTMASRTQVPFYVPLTTPLGTGVVGGYAADFEVQGHEAARVVTQLLDGVAPPALEMPALVPAPMHVDWRQLRRFRIDERSLPPGAVVHFREPSIWEDHRNAIISAVTLVLLQAGLIAGLLVERRRRHEAETAAAHSRAELAHASRLAVAGELAAALAHEINQPLGAILSNADTAEMILDSDVDRRDLLRTIVADIRRDDVRASEVIRRLRTLLQKHDVERAPFSLDEAAIDVELVLRPEARRRGVSLTVQPSGTQAMLLGDRIQVQQVLINLVLNAMDAVADVPEPRRVVSVAVHQTPDQCTVRVIDRGHGIAPEDRSKVFESFFTTKRSGMGLGLSIARTIVDAHGGSIHAEAGAVHGSEFIVTLPTRASDAPRMAVPA